MPEYTNADLELMYLRSLGAVGTLLDCQAQIYGVQQWDYFSARSGLTPVNLYSLADHKYAYYKGAATAWTEKRRNLVRYPNAELGAITGWAARSGGVVSVDAATKKSGGFSYRADVAAVSSGIQMEPTSASVPLSSGTAGTEAYSLEILSPVGLDLRVQSEEATPAGVFVASRTNTPVTGNGAWQRVAANWTKSNPSNVLRLYIVATVATAGSFYVDEVISEGLSPVGGYFDGATSPATALEQYRWLGAADASGSVYETRLSDVVSSGSLTDVQRRFWKLALGL